MTQLGSAHPTCDRCGAPLKIGIFGDLDPDGLPGDLLTMRFQMPAPHHCRTEPPAPTVDRVPAAAH